MLRELNVNGLRWADKTMSVLHERALEACEDRLNDFPACDPFDQLGDQEAEELWLQSYAYGEADPSEDARLHLPQDLRDDVLERVLEEAALLSEEEHRLVEGLIYANGSLPLYDLEQWSAAESLLRRMWCHIEHPEEDVTVLCMGSTLMRIVASIIANPGHAAIRERLLIFDRTVRAMLYLNGYVRAIEMMDCFNKIMDGVEIRHGELVWRYLHVAFDYVYDHGGDMMLLHPGLADPEALMNAVENDSLKFVPGNAVTLFSAVYEMLPDEVSSAARMFGAIHGAVRPEITEQGALEDLRILVKQGVPLDELQEVLSTMLITQPTREMKDALRLLSVETARWVGSKPQVLN